MTPHFYTDDELVSDRHQHKIRFMQGNPNRYIRYFNELVKPCFRRFVTDTARQITLDDVQVDTSQRSAHFLQDAQDDILSLFLSEYYTLPSVTELNPENRNEIIELDFPGFARHWLIPKNALLHI